MSDVTAHLQEAPLQMAGLSALAGSFLAIILKFRHSMQGPLAFRAEGMKGLPAAWNPALVS